MGLYDKKNQIVKGFKLKVKVRGGEDVKENKKLTVFEGFE
jgi:hypothetical protein